MAPHYHDERSTHGPRPAALPRFVTTVLAVVCVAGPVVAWTWDAASVRIVQPAGNNIDSGAVVAPSAVVRNLGDSTASFPVLFSITPDYLDTVGVDSLASGDSITLTFADWTAHQRGSTTAACSTALAVDESTANDRVSRTFNVRVRDVSVDSIVAPVDTIYFGQTITPQAWVTNHGTGNANFVARFRIAASYNDSQFVFGLASGATRMVSFTNWTADAMGTIALACTTAMASDTLVVGNNLVLDSSFVQVFPEDAGVMHVVAPHGVVDSGAVYQPQAMVRNYGSSTISFPAIFKIGSTYADTQQVTALASFDSLLVAFADWTASTLGTFTTQCSTALSGDPLSSNDMRSDSVRVIVRTTDAGAVRIIAPPDTVDSGSTYPAQAVVRNFGIASLSFQVKLRVGGSWADTVQVDSLAAGESLSVTFADYTVPRRGPTTCVCSTWVTGDQDASNDRVTKNVFRRVRDVSADSILAPTGLVPVPFDTVITPSARLSNFGNTTDSFPVVFRIGTFYEDTARTNDTVVTFRPCTLNVAGTLATQCSTAMVGDLFPTNDVVFDSVQVMPLGISSAKPVPGIPRTVTLGGAGPIAGRVAIMYGLPRSADVRLEVYDACGRLVRVIVAGAGQPGYHTAVWQCADERGRAVPQGAYFVRLAADGTTLTSKVVKLE